MVLQNLCSPLVCHGTVIPYAYKFKAAFQYQLISYAKFVITRNVE